MEFDAFTSNLGLGQGRILPKNSRPSSGDFAFVLGQDEPGVFFELTPGDRAEVSQDVEVTGQDIVRAHLHLRVPASTPDGLLWEAALTVDGIAVARTTCPTGKERTITDLVANVSKLFGVHSISIRLILVEH